MAVHLFAQLMLEGQTVTMFGDGSSARDYTYIDDIVDGIMASIERCDGYETFNLGGSKTTTLKELIYMVGRHLDIEPSIVTEPVCAGDVTITNADVSKSERMLGYSPKVGMEEGVKHFCEWLKRAQLPHYPQY